MNKTIKISILIPVYNVDNYIERCARSLFMQTMNDGLEYIFVNDFSTDNSIEILNKVIEEYPHRRDNVKVIHHEKNLGLMWARKTGIQNASGNLIFFCDSDDSIPSNAVEKLYNYYLKNNNDIIFGNFVKIYSNGKTITINRNIKKKATKISLKEEIFLQNNYYIWGILFKKELFKIDYDILSNQTLSEDAILLSQILDRTNDIGFSNVLSYCYYINKQSSTNSSITEDKVLSQVKAWNWLYDYHKIKNNRNFIEKFIIRSVIFCIEIGWEKKLIENNLKHFKSIFTKDSIFNSYNAPYNLINYLIFKNKFCAYIFHRLRIIKEILTIKWLNH